MNVATQFATAAAVLALVLLYHVVKTPYVQLEDARRRVRADEAAADFDIALLPERSVSRADAPVIEFLVTNRGTTSEFEAFIEAAEGMEVAPTEKPALRWKDADGKRCPITRGHSETLVVAVVYGGDVDGTHNVGVISFQMPREDERLHGRVFSNHGDLLAAEVTIYLRITSLDPWAQKEWPITITFEVEMQMIRPRIEVGSGRVV